MIDLKNTYESILTVTESRNILLNNILKVLNNVYLGLKQFGLICVSPEGVYKRLEGRFGEADLVMSPVGGIKILTSNPLSAFKYGLTYFDENQSFSSTFEELFNQKLTPIYSFTQKAKDGSVFISVNGFIVHLKNGRLIGRPLKVSAFNIWMSIDDDNNLWVSLFEGGVYMYSNCDLTKKPDLTLLVDCQVTSAFVS